MTREEIKKQIELDELREKKRARVKLIVTLTLSGVSIACALAAFIINLIMVVH